MPAARHALVAIALGALLLVPPVGAAEPAAVTLTACPLLVQVQPGGIANVTAELSASDGKRTVTPTTILRAADGTSVGLVNVWRVKPAKANVTTIEDAHVPFAWRVQAPSDAETAAAAIDVTLGIEGARLAPDSRPLVLRVELGALGIRANGSATCGSATYVFGERADVPPLAFVPDMTPLGLALAAAAGGANAILARRAGRAWWALGSILPLYTRLTSSRLLDHATRRRVHAAIEARPGILFSELRATLDLSTGVIDHHTRILVRDRLVTTHKLGRHRAYFPAGVPPPTDLRPRLGATAQKLVELVDARGETTYAEIMRVLALSKPAVSHHVHSLQEKGILELVQAPDGRWIVRRAGVRSDS